MVIAGPAAPARPRRPCGAARVWERGLSATGSVVGLTHEVRGRERIPAGPAVFAIKHQSAWETLTVHLLLADPAIVLKRELSELRCSANICSMPA